MAAGLLVAPVAYAQRIAPNIELRPIPNGRVELVQHVASASDFPKKLSPARKSQALEIAAILRSGKHSVANNRWGDLVRGMRADKMDEKTIEAVMLIIAQKGVLEADPQMNGLFHKYQAANTLSSALDSYITELKTAMGKASVKGFGFALADPTLTIVDGDLARLPLRTMTRKEGEMELNKLTKIAEETRGRRKQLASNFEAADQKTNQVMQTLSTVVKTLNEIRMAGARSGMAP
jgi:hypothetical protein